MSKQIMDAVDKMNEGAITPTEDDFERRKAERLRRKAERDAKKKAEEEAKVEGMKSKFMPAFVKEEAEEKPKTEKPKAEKAEAESAAAKKPAPKPRPKAKKEEPKAKEKAEEKKPLGKKVQKSISLPVEVWEALDKYCFEKKMQEKKNFTKSEYLLDLLKADPEFWKHVS